MSDFLTPIVKALSDALSPLEISFSNKEELEAFLFKYGWDYRVDEGDLNPINTAFAVIPFFDVLFENLDELINGSDEERFLATVDVLEAVKNLVTHISDLAPGGLGGLPAPFDQANFWSELSEALFPDLLAIYLKSHQRAIYCLLHITGVIQYQRQTPAEAGRVNYTKTVVDWNQLGTALANPYDAINDLYKWNKSGQTFDHEALLRAVEECLLSLGVPASVGPPRPELATPLIHDNSILIVPDVSGLTILRRDLNCALLRVDRADLARHLVAAAIDAGAGGGDQEPEIEQRARRRLHQRHPQALARAEPHRRICRRAGSSAAGPRRGASGRRSDSTGGSCPAGCWGYQASPSRFWVRRSRSPFRRGIRCPLSSSSPCASL